MAGPQYYSCAYIRCTHTKKKRKSDGAAKHNPFVNTLNNNLLHTTCYINSHTCACNVHKCTSAALVIIHAHVCANSAVKSFQTHAVNCAAKPTLLALHPLRFISKHRGRLSTHHGGAVGTRYVEVVLYAVERLTDERFEDLVHEEQYVFGPCTLRAHEYLRVSVTRRHFHTQVKHACDGYVHAFNHSLHVYM